MSTVNPFSIVTTKQVANLLQCHPNTAAKILHDIREHYKLPKYVLYKHFTDYLKI